MRIVKMAVASAAAAAMLASPMAYARNATRSNDALPSASVQQAPTAGVRNAAPSRKRSHLAGGPGTAVIGVLAIAAIVGGIVAATSNNNDAADSPG